MSNTIKVAIAPDVFIEKCAQLKAQQGIDIAGSEGKISKDGVEAAYFYDGVGFLTVEVTKKPWEDPMSVVLSRLTAWLEAPVTT